MKRIEVKILNPEVIPESVKMMVCAARLTQKGHAIKNLGDFMDLYNKPYSEKTVESMISLPHPTIQKFGAVNMVVVGASRRFLAQITRHQNEVKFMSASLQYSDYSENTGDENFEIPYHLLNSLLRGPYLDQCRRSMETYKTLVEYGVDNDEAGYAAPQGLRNALIISATPYQWKHMIGQRICRRNTLETRYVFLKIWEALYQEDPIFFSEYHTGPFCESGPCKEGKMTCGRPMRDASSGPMAPRDILKEDFPLLEGDE